MATFQSLGVSVLRDGGGGHKETQSGAEGQGIKAVKEHNCGKASI